MKKHAVYFQIGKKKMKVSVYTDSEEEAKEELFKKIIFHKIEVEEDKEFNETMGKLNQIKNEVDKL